MADLDLPLPSYKSAGKGLHEPLRAAVGVTTGAAPTSGTTPQCGVSVILFLHILICGILYWWEEQLFVAIIDERLNTFEDLKPITGGGESRTRVRRTIQVKRLHAYHVDLAQHAKPADYRRQVVYHYLTLSDWVRSADYRRQPDLVLRLRSPHPITAQAARAGATLVLPTNLWASFNVASRPTTACYLTLPAPVDTITPPNRGLCRLPHHEVFNTPAL